LLGLQSSFEGFQAVHALILGSIYLYSCLRTFVAARAWGAGSSVFSLALPVDRFLNNAAVFFYLYNRGGHPQGPAICKYSSVSDLYCSRCWRSPPWPCGSNASGTASRPFPEADVVRRDNRKISTWIVSRDWLKPIGLERRIEGASPSAAWWRFATWTNFKRINDQYGHWSATNPAEHRAPAPLLHSPGDEAFRWAAMDSLILFRNQKFPVVRIDD